MPQGCELLCCLSNDASYDVKVKLGRSGACEALVASLDAFGKSNAKVAHYVRSFPSEHIYIYIRDCFVCICNFCCHLLLGEASNIVAANTGLRGNFQLGANERKFAHVVQLWCT